MGRTCPQCGVEITCGRRDKRYCSYICRSRATYHRNPEPSKARAKAWRAANRDKDRLSSVKNSAEYRRCNPEKVKLQHSNFRKRNPEKITAWSLAWANKNQVRVREIARKYLRSKLRFRGFLRFAWNMERIAEQLEDKMTVVAAGELEQALEAVKALTTEQLKEQFAEGMRVTRDRLLRMAAIIVELESRGEKVEGDRFLCNLLRKIGRGDILVDSVVRFAGRPYVMAAVNRLPAEEQERILKIEDDTEAEYEATKASRSAGRDRHSGPQPRVERSQRERPAMIDQAANASPGDLADTIVDMIRSNSCPLAVLDKVLPLLNDLHKSMSRHNGNTRSARG